MTVYLYRLTKRKNSTLQPKTGSGTEVEAVLKDGTDILKPVLELKRTDRPTENYCYIPDFARYYFVTNWEYNRGIWACALTVDVCATYKPYILTYEAFVERSASDYDIDINDNLLSVKQSLEKVELRNETIPGVNPLNGCYLVRINGGASHVSATGIYTYALTANELGALLSFLYNSQNFTDVLQEDYVKALFNPMDYITSIKWFPFAADSLSSAVVNIFVGWWQTGVTGRLITTLGAETQCTIEPPARYYNDFRDLNPEYTQFQLYIPSFGVIDIPPEVMYHNGGLWVRGIVDYMTGQFFVMIYIGDSEKPATTGLLTTAVGMIGYDIQVGQVVSNSSQAVSSAVGAVAQALTGNFAGAAASTVDAVKNTLTTTSKTLGSAGGAYGFFKTPWYTLARRVNKCAEYPVNVAGRPLMKNRLLNGLQGYVKCGGASVPISGYDSERDALNAMLNTGFYME